MSFASWRRRDPVVVSRGAPGGNGATTERWSSLSLRFLRTKRPVVVEALETMFAGEQITKGSESYLSSPCVSKNETT